MSRFTVRLKEPISPLEPAHVAGRVSRMRSRCIPCWRYSPLARLIFTFGFVFFAMTVLCLWFYLAFPKPMGQAEAQCYIARPDYPESTITDIHRSFLEGDEVAAYDAVEDAMRSMKSGVDFPSHLSAEQTSLVYNSVMDDNPDIFWASTAYFVCPSFDGVSGITFDYLYSDPEEVVSKHNDYIAKANLYVEQFRFFAETDEGVDHAYEAREAYDWLAMTLAYEHGMYDQTISGCFENTNNSTVCAGYARGFQLLCYAMGIPCTYVTGATSSEADSSHAWNACWCDGDVYYVDATWGDIGDSCITRDKYFTVDGDKFGHDHMALNKEIYTRIEQLAKNESTA